MRIKEGGGRAVRNGISHDFFGLVANARSIARRMRPIARRMSGINIVE